MQKKYTVLMKPTDPAPGADCLWEQVKAGGVVEAADAGRRLANARLRQLPQSPPVHLGETDVLAVVAGWPELTLDPYNGASGLSED